MPNENIDYSFVKAIDDGELAWVVFCVAHRRNVSMDTKRAMLTSAIRKGLVSMYIGIGKGNGVWSSYVNPSCIEEFFRDCCLFKERPGDMPKDFTIGRTRIGNQIRIVINGNFTEPMCRMMT